MSTTSEREKVSVIVTRQKYCTNTVRKGRILLNDIIIRFPLGCDMNISVLQQLKRAQQMP